MKDAFQGYQTLVCSRLARTPPTACMINLLYCFIDMDMLSVFTVLAFQVVMSLHLLCNARRKAMHLTIAVDISLRFLLCIFLASLYNCCINAAYGYNSPVH